MRSGRDLTVNRGYVLDVAAVIPGGLNAVLPQFGRDIGRGYELVVGATAASLHGVRSQEFFMGAYAKITHPRRNGLLNTSGLRGAGWRSRSGLAKARRCWQGPRQQNDRKEMENKLLFHGGEPIEFTSFYLL